MKPFLIPGKLVMWGLDTGSNLRGDGRKVACLNFFVVFDFSSRSQDACLQNKTYIR